MLRGLCCSIAILGLFLAVEPDPLAPDPESSRPIAAKDSVFMEEMTWMEIRDAMRAGKTTAIIATGGLEQNGPYLATGKHNIILRGTTDAIARKLKNALVATIVPYVPEGDLDPPTLHMKYPGSISLTEETYERLLTDLCTSMKVHGFKNIVLIGDSGGNQDGMKAVAANLNAKWDTTKTKVQFIPEYYDYAAVAEWLKQQGINEVFEGIHDEFAISALMMAVDPESIRARQRIAAGQFRINGIELAPVEKTIEWGKRIIEFRADATVKAIRAATGE
jgi:creatinine amidohydrolase/Fe(II)-dependent formamide hydrolase-like protein